MSSAAKKSSSCETFTIYHGKTGPRRCQEQTGGYSEAADVQRYASRKAGRVSSRIPSNILKNSERWSIWHRPHAAGSPHFLAGSKPPWFSRSQSPLSEGNSTTRVKKGEYSLG